MPATPTVALREGKVRELRIGRKLTQLELAQRIGYSLPLVKKIEGGYPPSRTAAWYIALAFDVPTEDITADGAPIPEPVANPQHVARVRVPA
jgi:transcriptional regulator with XRE-family HTH domain